MNVHAHLAELPALHPHLLWDEISLALVAVCSPKGGKATFKFELSVLEVPGCYDDHLRMTIDRGSISRNQVNRIKRTYEAPRLVELAAIAIAGLGIFHAGGHQIRDVALRGTAADYLVDEDNNLLEIAGRSRHADLESAWQQKWQRLTDNLGSGFYVCVTEFETRTGRLAFKH